MLYYQMLKSNKEKVQRELQDKMSWIRGVISETVDFEASSAVNLSRMLSRDAMPASMRHELNELVVAGIKDFEGLVGLGIVFEPNAFGVVDSLHKYAPGCDHTGR
ncbi:MAG: hypothetical protein CSA49_02515, partial [Gammaproteobacteria bacterium]